MEIGSVGEAAVFLSPGLSPSSLSQSPRAEHLEIKKNKTKNYALVIHTHGNGTIAQRR